MFEIQGSNNSSGENSKSAGRNMETESNLFSNTIAFHTTVLNGMSHEMRTHMNAIVAFSFLLRDSTLKEPEKEDFINQIYFTCEKLISLFENYLESAIVDTGGSSSDEVFCDMNNLLDVLILEFREVLRKSGKDDLELVTEAQHFGVNDVICIDKTKIFRILRCLFYNSLQNTNSGYIKIGYSFGDNNITFYVLDSGQGLSRTSEFLYTNDLSSSLTKYHDITSAVNISLAKKLIQFLQGTFDIRGNGANGTGIYVTIPVSINEKTDTAINRYVNSMF